MTTPALLNTVLAWHDLQWCLRRAPRKLLETMKKHGSAVMVAGGYIRSCISNDTINDVDLFCGSKEFARVVALELAEGDEKRLHTTDNAYTVKGYRTPIQLIHRWTFDSPETAIFSFDFTIARAAFWWTSVPTEIDATAGKWRSVCDARFYPDLAGKRLVYCQPTRIEEVGGSLLRVLKFYQRGYRIPLDSLAAVVSRLMSGVNDVDKLSEASLATVLSGLLREVDPMIDPSHAAHLPTEDGEESVAHV